MEVLEEEGEEEEREDQANEEERKLGKGGEVVVAMDL